MIPLPFTLLFWVQIYTPFLCFLSREYPLAFVGELVWWCWILLAFACLKSFWFLLHIWMRSLLGTIIWAVGYFLSSLWVYPAIPSWPEGFLLKDQLVVYMGIPLCFIHCFPLAAFNICSLYLIFVNLINTCLGVFCLGFILFGTLWVSLTFVAIFFRILGKCSTIISSSIFMAFLFVFFLESYDSNAGMIHIIPEVVEVVLIYFNSFFFLFFSPLHLFPSFYFPPHLSYLMPQLFYCLFLPEIFCSQLLHYSLLIDSFLFILGPC